MRTLPYPGHPRNAEERASPPRSASFLSHLPSRALPCFPQGRSGQRQSYRSVSRPARHHSPARPIAISTAPVRHPSSVQGRTQRCRSYEQRAVTKSREPRAPSQVQSRSDAPSSSHTSGNARHYSPPHRRCASTRRSRGCGRLARRFSRSSGCSDSENDEHHSRHPFARRALVSPRRRHPSPSLLRKISSSSTMLTFHVKHRPLPGAR